MDALQGVFQSLPIDYFLLGGLTILVALDALRSGLGRAAALAVAFPLSAFLFSLLQGTILIGSLLSSPLLETVAFGALVGLTYFFARRIGLEYVDGGTGNPLQAAIAGVAVVAIFVVIWLSTPMLGSYWEFGSQIQVIFAEQFRLIWLLGAYGALVFARS